MADNGIHTEPLHLWATHACPTTTISTTTTDDDEYVVFDLQLQWLSHAPRWLFYQWHAHVDHFAGVGVLTCHEARHLPVSHSFTATCSRPTRSWSARPLACGAVGWGKPLHQGTGHRAWDSGHHGWYAGNQACLVSTCFMHKSNHYDPSIIHLV